MPALLSELLDEADMLADLRDRDFFSLIEDHLVFFKQVAAMSVN